LKSDVVNVQKEMEPKQAKKDTGAQKELGRKGKTQETLDGFFAATPSSAIRY
jgi:hypothetical protein